MPIQKYYVQSEKNYFHHSQYYDRSVSRYKTENETCLSQLVIEEIFDCFDANVTLSTKLVIGDPPRRGQIYKEDYDSQAWYPVVYEVYVLDPSKIEKNKTSTNNLVIHNVYFGSETPVRFYPDSYLSIIKKHAPQGGEAVIKGIKALFHDYAKPQLFSLHCRSHALLAKDIIDRLPDNLDGAYTYLLTQREKLFSASDTNTKGSMAHRLNFSIAQLAQELQKQELEHQNSISIVLN